MACRALLSGPGYALIPWTTRGGTPAERRQLEACRQVAADLNPLGLHLLGLDFIGEHLTEVNFTSPTTIVQINQVNSIRADRALVDELEVMWRQQRSAPTGP